MAYCSWDSVQTAGGCRTMNLRLISRLCIFGCVVGLVILGTLTAYSANRLDSQREAIADLLSLQERIDDFSAASDAIAMLGADEQLWAAFQADAERLKGRLLKLGEEHPDARKGALRIDHIMDIVSYGLNDDDPLNVSAPERIFMQQVAQHGISLDTALDDALREREVAIENESLRIGAMLAFSALGFGALCVAAFGLLHGKVARPVLAIADTLERMRAGDTHIRAKVEGHNELSRLANSLNQTMDERDRFEVTLQEREENLRLTLAELEATRDRLEASLEMRQVLVDSLPAHIALLDEDGVVVYVNNQWRHYGEQNEYSGPGFGVGYNYKTVCNQAIGQHNGEEADEVGAGLQEVLAGERHSYAKEYPCHSPNEERWFRVMFSRLENSQGGLKGSVAMHVDVTERKKAERELERLAYEDPLTRALSRTGFVQYLDNAMSRDEWPSGGIVAMADVVDQHDINETYGYDAGDHLLGIITSRFQELAGQDGLVARTGGDEFALYLPATGGKSARELADFVKGAVANTFKLRNDTINLEVDLHLGYTELAGSRRAAAELLREAELALFEHRTSNAVGHAPFPYSETLKEQTRNRIQVTSDLNDALRNNEFELHFQPKVNLQDGSVVSAEALIRWRHPKRGLMPPGLFIPVAEQSQQILPIGDWALREACRQLSEWRANGLDAVLVAVNVSVIQFMMGDFSAKVRAVLDEFRVDPQHLSIEITESVFEKQSEHLLTEMHKLHDMGVRLSLDDFGTGYSSLLYLQRYPFDEIKIDKGFVDRVLDNEFDQNIVNAVMNMSRSLNAEVVAEGIETRAVSDKLYQLGVRIGQGFYYSMPLESEDFRWLLEQKSKLPLDI